MKKVLIFDFDGTIADSLDAIVRLMNRHSKQFGYHAISPEARDHLKNINSTDIVRDFGLSPWRLFWLALKVKRDLAHELADIPLAPGMYSTLKELRARGFVLGIATSNSKANVIQFLRRHRLEREFDFIYARTVFFKAAMLRWILRRYGYRLSQVVYIGDESRDVIAAKQVGIKVIAVSWGMHAEHLLRSFNPDHVVSKPESLLEKV